MALIKCQECGKEISDKSEKCINCGYPIRENRDEIQPGTEKMELNDNRNKKAKGNKKYIIGAIAGIAIIIIVVFWLIGSKKETDSGTKQNVVAAESEQITEQATEQIKYEPIDANTNIEIGKYETTDFEITYGEGTYKVGTDIPAGKYVGFGPQGWTGNANVYPDASKSEAINLTYDWGNHFIFVDVEEGNYLEVSGFFIVPFEELEKKGLENYGIFVGGKTLPVGEYKLTPFNSKDDGFYKVYENYTEESGVKFRYFSNTEYITIEQGDIFVAQNSSLTAPNEQGEKENGKSKNNLFDTIYEANMYRVGKDMDAGTYVAYGPQQWTTSIVITNSSLPTEGGNNLSFNSCIILKLDKGMYVDVYDGAYLVPYELVEQKDASDTGIYKVGKDIDAGEYKLTVQSKDASGYWSLYTDLDIAHQIKFNYFDGQEYTEIKDDEIFVLQNAAYEKQ